MKHHLVPRIVRPVIDQGVDYSSRRAVLVRVLGADDKPVKELRWHFAGTYWSNINEPRKKFSAELEVVEWDAPINASYRAREKIGVTIVKARLLSRAVMQESQVQQALLQHFGIDVVNALRTMNLQKQTLVVEP